MYARTRTQRDRRECSLREPRSVVGAIRCGRIHHWQKQRCGGSKDCAITYPCMQMAPRCLYRWTALEWIW
eukprot:COSAG02_NODE_64142_length_261_cov_0.697531_1_plen_69_part_10